MHNKAILKTWCYENKLIHLLFQNGQLSAKLCSMDGKEFSIIPHHDIDIPKPIKHDLIQLSIFLTHAKMHRLVQCSNGDYRIYFHIPLKGAGYWDFLFSTLQVVAGYGLGSLSPTPLGVVVGGALVSAGINGMYYAAQTKKNFGRDYINGSNAGLLSGAITSLNYAARMTEVGNAAETPAEKQPSHSTTSTVVTAMASNAVAQATSRLICERKLDAKSVGINTVIGGAAAAVLPTKSFNHPVVIATVPYHTTNATMLLWRSCEKKKIKERAEDRADQKEQKRSDELGKELQIASETNTACLDAQATIIKELDAVKRAQDIRIAALQAELAALNNEEGLDVQSDAAHSDDSSKLSAAQFSAISLSTDAKTDSSVKKPLSVLHTFRARAKENDQHQDILDDNREVLERAKASLAEAQRVINEHQDQAGESYAALRK